MHSTGPVGSQGVALKDAQIIQGSIFVFRQLSQSSILPCHFHTRLSKMEPLEYKRTYALNLVGEMDFDLTIKT